MLSLVVTDRQDLHRVDEEIHDWFYDVDDVVFNPARSTVIVEGNLPVTIEARVHALAIEVEQTDELLGIARYRTTGSAQSYSGEIFPLSLDDTRPGL